MYMEKYQKKTIRNFMIDYRGDNMGRKYKSYSYEEYMKATDMLREGYKPPEISRTLGISIQTIYDWKHGVMPPLARWTVKPCIELAYIIGILHGDGTVCKDELRGQ